MLASLSSLLCAGLVAGVVTGPPVYAVPSARERSEQRDNSVVTRPLDRWVIGVAAAVRMGVEVGSGGAFLRHPIGFGFGLDLRFHGLRIGPMRFGVQLQGGHTRFPALRGFSVTQADGQVVMVNRKALLAHSDIMAGPSLQAPIGPVLLEFGGSGGLIVSQFYRPRSADPFEDQSVVGYSPGVRGDIGLGIPIVHNQGLRLGANFTKIFSSVRVVGDLNAPEGTAPDSLVFDMYLDISLAYQAWF